MNQTNLSFSQIEDLPPAVNENYSDIIFRYELIQEVMFQRLSQYTSQSVNAQYRIFHAPLSSGFATVEEIGYFSVPKLFTFIDTTSLESAGILGAQLQPFLNLRGKGVLVGFLDSGIDYTHPAFRNPDGTTRILRIWDQSDQSGPSPENMGYGTEYTESAINEALRSADPYLQVPQRDEIGHGTAVAGIACGSADPDGNFIGAAPESKIAFVRLKPAKQYLREYFRVPDDAVTYQETDLMLGITYLLRSAKELALPLVICMSLGTNQGGHTGHTPLEDVLTEAQFYTSVHAVAGTGNESGKGHHYFGRLNRAEDYVDVELLVNQETKGFSIEFWADSPELYSIGFTSPLGETIQPIQPRTDTSREFNFLLENSVINLTYSVVEMLSGAQLALIRFRSPTEGIWRIRIVNKIFINGIFHMWLPISGLVDPDIRFYSPSTDTTLTIPSCAEAVITVSTYNAYNNSLYINSGRGYTRNGIIKPEFASPGVDVTAPFPGGSYTAMTGSCAACALTAGATALLVESGLLQETPRYFTTREIKSLFLRGTQRTSFNTYPNREWGYGTMNLYGIFESFLRS